MMGWGFVPLFCVIIAFKQGNFDSAQDEMVV